jgi:membrane carboxypeptidase/penicillin-binding protein
MKLFLRFIAKIFFKSKYRILRQRVLFEYSKISHECFFGLDNTTKLLISGEDHRFFYHIGFDIISIVRAIRSRIFFNRIEGASTIEQQLVRVLSNDFERTFRRKLREILLATTLTTFVPKKAIPKIYLNVAYYGAGMNGLQQALKKLNIGETNIDLYNAAELVSRIKYPQPNQHSAKRQFQIQMRKRYLLDLHERHFKRKFLKVYVGY